VDIRYLIAKKTIDEYIWKSIKNKLDVVGEALDGELNAKWEITNEKFTNQKSLDLYFKPMEIKEVSQEKENESKKINDKAPQTIEKEKESRERETCVDLTDEETIKEPPKENPKEVKKTLIPTTKPKITKTIEVNKIKESNKRKLDIVVSSQPKKTKGTLDFYFTKK
jgi:hypothetical protein